MSACMGVFLGCGWNGLADWQYSRISLSYYWLNTIVFTDREESDLKYSYPKRNSMGECMAAKTKRAKIKSINIKRPLYRFGRREFCAGLAIGAGAAIAGDFAIRCAWRKLSSDVDVVIVGAGAAG